MKELVELIVKKLVEHPDEVQLNTVDGEEGQLILELRVNPEDMGRVIGKAGKTAKAIRTLVNAAAARAELRVMLRILE